MKYPRRYQFKSNHKYQVAMREWRKWRKGNVKELVEKLGK